MNPRYSEKHTAQMEKAIVAFLKEQGFEPGPELTVAMIGAIFTLAMSVIMKEEDNGRPREVVE